ncbi:MAG: hypothetical protein JSR29_18095 [Nitrospira sp.]|nr:hypothetical protein [Nitrospira sp.]
MLTKNGPIPGNFVVVAIFLTLLIIHSCTARPHLVIHQSDTLSVVLRELPGGYPSINPFHHPYTIPPETVVDILESLTYEADAVLPLSKTHPRRVFTKPQAERLAPELAEALSLAPPQQVTAFTITETDKPDRQTKGLAFVLNDELHLIIEALRRPRYEGEQNTYQQPISTWKLRPTSPQRLYAHRPDGKGAMTNWIITPLRKGS